MAKFFIFRPVLAIVTAIIMTLLGIVAGVNLPVAQYPQITLPAVQVSAYYAGASAEVVEQAVAQPIEEVVNGVSGALYMSSNSSGNGSYSLTVTFELGVDPDIAAVQVQNRVSQASLPQEVLTAGVTVQKQTSDTLMYIAVMSPKNTYDALFLTNYTIINVVDSIKRIEGVGGVNLFGADFSMRVWLYPDRMSSLGVATSDVANAIKQQNLLVPTGQLGQLPGSGDQQFQYNMNVQGQLSDVEEFNRIIIRSNPDGSFVRLGDVAKVELGASTYAYQGMVNGQPAASFSVNLAPGASALETSALINAELESLAQSFPEDLVYDVVLDNTIFVKTSLQEVLVTLAETLLLVLLVVFVFLQRWRATLIPMLAVPVSLIGTLAVFLVVGFTINTLTLFAIVLAIGIVVDDAIVVVEAVKRHMDDDGMQGREAALKAMESVSGPIVATSLVLTAVFAPVAFLGGVSGVMYQQFAVTVAVSTVLSAIVALSLTPVLCTLLLKPESANSMPAGPLGRFLRWFDQSFERLTEHFGNKVQAAIRRSGLVLSLLAIVVFGAIRLADAVPSGFVPQEDQGYFIGNLQMPTATSLNRTESAGKKVSAMLQQQAVVSKVLMINGFNFLTGAPQSDSALFITLLKPWSERPQGSLQASIDEISQQVNSLPEVEIRALNPPPIPGLGAAGGFSMELQDRIGGSPFALAQTAQEFVVAANQRPEIGYAYSSFNPDNPAYELTLNRDKIAELGLSVAEVLQTLQVYLSGVPVNTFSRFGRTYNVMVQAESQYRSSIDDIGQFSVRNQQNEMVPMSDLVTAKLVGSPNSLSRFDLFQSAQIGGSPAPGYSSGQAMEALQEVADNTLPQGYGYQWSGISLQEQESAGRAPIMFGLAFVMVFLLLAALYESWSVPFAVLLAVPLGIFGSLAGLWMGHLTNNIYAQIGFIVIIGLVAKNAILIVEFAKSQREEAGLGLIEAATTAAKLRLRPILMTSFAFLLGVLPLVLASSAGAAARVSMGTAVFSGMLFATPMGLFVVPVLYVVICKLVDRSTSTSAKGNGEVAA